MSIHPKAKIYIAGPMTGLPDWNFPAFNRLEARLKERGFMNVFNPACCDGGSTHHPREFYLRIDVKQLADADYCLLLPGWKTSAGARLEAAIAKELNITCKEVEYDEQNDIYTFQGMCESMLPVVTLPEWSVEVRDSGCGREDAQDAPGRVADWDGSDIVSATPEALAGHTEGQSVLTEAEGLVHGDRAASYGHPREDFSRTAAMWKAMLGFEVTPEQVGLCMVAVKLSRHCHRPKRDNLVDIAGYAETVRMVQGL